MSWSSQYRTEEDTRHKVFISYYHKDDEYYRNRFEELFGHLFINKSVEPGDIDADLSTDYIKRLIREGYITDSSVIVVLVGPKTHCRKHVDWEIYAGIDGRAGGYSGLVGLCLPNHPASSTGKYDPDTVPPRLIDNLKSGYAKFYYWTTSEDKIQGYIVEAFQNRVDKPAKIDNSRTQFKYNRCD